MPMRVKQAVLDTGPILEYGLLLASDALNASRIERDPADRFKRLLTHATNPKRRRRLKDLVEGLERAWTLTPVWTEVSGRLQDKLGPEGRGGEPEVEQLKSRFWRRLRESPLLERSTGRGFAECSLRLRDTGEEAVIRVGYTDAALIELTRRAHRRARDVVLITVEGPDGDQARLAREHGVACRSLEDLLS